MQELCSIFSHIFVSQELLHCFSQLDLIQWEDNIKCILIPSEPYSVILCGFMAVRHFVKQVWKE